MFFVFISLRYIHLYSPFLAVSNPGEMSRDPASTNHRQAGVEHPAADCATEKNEKKINN